MKPGKWTTFWLLFPLLALAAEEAPPAEVLKNLDFFQNLEMVEDNQYLKQTEPAAQDVDPSTAPVKNEGASHENKG